MNKKKEIKTVSLLLIALLFINGLFAQDITTVNALNDDISNHLDLEAVASIFGDSKDLEDFEKRLNDPKIQISNLDLNEDAFVDYLRVVEISENNTHIIAIQAVLGEDLFQDIATIEIEKDTKGVTNVQVVGDVYIYGRNYIIEPVYIHRPVVFSLFWRPFYHPYKSVYYWGYYPKHFHFWHPHPIHIYRKKVHVHINVKHTYSHTHVRRSKTAIHLHKKTRRNDFAKKHPNKPYNARIVGVNKANGTKKRANGIQKTDGTKKRIAGVNQADGDKYRTAGVTKANGTKKRIVGVNKTDGTNKRGVAVKRQNGSKKVVTTKKKPTGKYKNKTRKGKGKRKKGVKKTKGKITKKKKK